MHIEGCAKPGCVTMAAAPKLSSADVQAKEGSQAMVRNLCTQDTGCGVLRERCSFHCTAGSMGLVATAFSHELAHTLQPETHTRTGQWSTLMEAPLQGRNGCLL